MFNYDKDLSMTMHLVRSWVATAAVVAIGSAGLTGCAGMNNKAKGAVIGATTGGVVGGVIGKNTGSGSTAKGAIIGAAIGGTAGAIIGHQMDQQAKELRQNIPGAKVERVGEGIQVTFDSGLLFDFGSSSLRPEARSNLQTLANSLQQYPGSELMIVGHTDSRGADDFNQRLSEQRAASAAGYLATQGVGRSRIHTRGLGEYEPVASNETDAGRQQNRRVEVAIYASEAYREQVRSRNGR
jgi:outer membrane protein OmpA-like peptidoglycan-associated protein